jgi:nucleoside-diphosphate-sugar epimerase
MISEVTGRPAEVRYLPPRGFDVPHIVLDAGKLTRETGWTARTSLVAGTRLLYGRILEPRS